MVRDQTLEEFLDLDGKMAVVFLKRSDGDYPLRPLAQPTLFFPRCSSRFMLEEKGRGTVLDAYTFLVLPPGHTPRIVGDTTISDAVVLAPSAALIKEVGGAYGDDVTRTLLSIDAPAILPRTNWLNEIMHRYVFERVVARHRGNLATSFLEAEIVKEVGYRFIDAKRLDKSRFDLDVRATDRRSALLRKAMDFVEANIFRDLTVSEIAEYAAVSESTVQREFKSGVGKTPTAYIVDRRLEEAMILIKSQRYSIGQVSDIVGYESQASFASAFKKRFGITPSQVISEELALDRTTV